MYGASGRNRWTDNVGVTGGGSYLPFQPGGRVDPESQQYMNWRNQQEAAKREDEQGHEGQLQEDAHNYTMEQQHAGQAVQWAQLSSGERQNWLRVQAQIYGDQLKAAQDDHNLAMQFEAAKHKNLTDTYNTLAKMGYWDDDTIAAALEHFGDADAAAKALFETGGIDPALWDEIQGNFRQGGAFASQIAQEGILSDQKLNELSANYGRQVQDQANAAGVSTMQGAINATGSPFAAMAIKGAGAGQAGRAVADARADLTIKDEESRLQGIDRLTANTTAWAGANNQMAQTKASAAQMMAEMAAKKAEIEGKAVPEWAKRILSEAPEQILNGPKYKEFDQSKYGLNPSLGMDSEYWRQLQASVHQPELKMTTDRGLAQEPTHVGSVGGPGTNPVGPPLGGSPQPQPQPQPQPGNGWRNPQPQPGNGWRSELSHPDQFQPQPQPGNEYRFQPLREQQDQFQPMRRRATANV